MEIPDEQFQKLIKISVADARLAAEQARRWATKDGQREGFTTGSKPWWDRYKAYRELIIDELLESLPDEP